MKCKKCRKVIPDDSKFCCYCGTSQAAKPKMYRRPDGLYEKVVTIGGRRVYFRGKTEKEVERKMLEYNEQRETGEPFRAVAEEWKEEHFPKLSPNSLSNYTPAFNRAVDYFADTPIAQIKPPDIQKFLAAQPSSWAQKTFATQFLILNLIFKYAAVKGMIETSPTEYIQPPHGTGKKRRRAASEDEIEKIIAAVDKPFGLYAYLLIYTGCRRCEALGLQYKHIDRENNVIHIMHEVYFKSNRPAFKEPKTGTSFRDIVLLDVLKEKIPEGKPEDFLFNIDGKPLSKSQFTAAWKRYAAASGVNELTPHIVRHGYATMLHDAGIDAKDAQELLGHAQISTTLDIYTHITKKRRTEVAEKLNDYAKSTQ